MTKPWRPVDYPAPLPHIIKKEEKPPKLTLVEQALELGDPLDWILSAGAFVVLISLMAWLFLGHMEVSPSP